MPITIDGTGSITGLSAGGLPDLSVTTAEIAAEAVTAPKLSGAQSGSAPIYGARAWVNFSGTGTVTIRAAGNVSSITDNGVGDYTVNFTTAMPDASYAVNAITGQTTSTSTNMGIGVRSSSATGADSSAFYLTTSIRLVARAGGGSVNDSDAVSVTVFR
jgi:hypothetical protein